MELSVDPFQRKYCRSCRNLCRPPAQVPAWCQALVESHGKCMIQIFVRLVSICFKHVFCLLFLCPEFPQPSATGSSRGAWSKHWLKRTPGAALRSTTDTWVSQVVCLFQLISVYTQLVETKLTYSDSIPFVNNWTKVKWNCVSRTHLTWKPNAQFHVADHKT